jgi:hypothetical protein
MYEPGGAGQPIAPQEFIRLQTGDAICKIDRTVFPLRTYLAPQHPDFERARQVIIRSRQNYAGRRGGEPPPRNEQKGLPPKRPEDEPPEDESIDPFEVF